MLYFMVDCEFGITLMDESDIMDMVAFYDARLFRTDGSKVEAMYVKEDDSIEWKIAEFNKRV